jgi:hypothetical protein
MYTFAVKMKFELLTSIFSMAALLLSSTGCQKSEPTNNDSPLVLLPTDSLITIQTPDHLNEAVHPDILWLNDKFYLVVTPYPSLNDKYENPCVYTSSNGLNFTEPQPNLNPLVPTPANGHNDDPDLFYSKKDKLFILTFLETYYNDSAHLIFMSSPDFIHWTQKAQYNYHFLKQEPDKFMASPSLIEKNDSVFLFYMNFRKFGDKKTEIEYLKSKDPLQWKTNKSYSIDITYPHGFLPWHLDVIKSETNEYYMLCTGIYTDRIDWSLGLTDYSLCLYKSADLNHWTFVREIIHKTEVPDPMFKYIYRSTGIIQENMLYLWYSYTTTDGKSKLGFKKTPIHPQL